MKRGSRVSPVIKIACPVCGLPPDKRCASDRYPSGLPGALASEFHRPERAAAAAGTR